jgi:hypothetical protein
MNSVLDSVLGALDQDSVHSIARQLGTRPEQAQGAIEAALPLLMGALGRNASQPQGAQALHRALERDHATSDLGSILGSVLGGGAGNGQAILGHVFGGREQRAAMGVGRMSGMDSGSAAQLLAMLAPLVMSALGQQTRSNGVDASSLGGLLGLGGGQDAPQSSPGIGGLLSVVLDRDGDGDVDFQDLMQGGGSDLLGSLFGGRR